MNDYDLIDLLGMERVINRAHESSVCEHPDILKKWHDAEVQSAIWWRERELAERSSHQIFS